jgi:formylglycine-generating enzyme required for sulfatase activity
MIPIRYQIHLVQVLFLSMFIVNAYAQTKGMGKPVNGKAPSGTERRVALVVGNKDYQSIGSLKNPINDANDMTKALQDLGFEVIKGTNVDFRGFMKSISDFKNKLSSSDIAFFYYSGHGASYNGQSYLLPTDADISCLEEIEYKGVSLTRILGEVGIKGVKNSFVILDACRNLPNIVMCDKSKRDLFTTKGLIRPNNNPSGSIVVYATKEGQTADDNPNSRNGLFTGSFLKYLTIPNLSIRSILDKTSIEVVKQSNNSQSPGRYEEIFGDFYFVVSDKDQPSPTIKPQEPEKVLPKTFATKYLDLPFADMAYIPGGTFEMGDTRNEGEEDEKPVHTVKLDGFYMGKYEVTQRQWKSIMGSNPSMFKDCSDCPVEQVSWEDVQEFLKKLNSLMRSNYRLPTEAEWEYAAGGGASSRTRFGNGADILESSGANFYAKADAIKDYSRAGEYRGKMTKVGSFRSNGLGLYDMIGNVFEWCSDWYGGYSSGSSINPTGSATGIDRVLRGGSWNCNSQDSRVAYRYGSSPAYRDLNNGFRIVLSQQ